MSNTIWTKTPPTEPGWVEFWPVRIEEPPHGQ